MLSLAVYVCLALVGNISCQYGTNSCAVTATSLGCATYRILTLGGSKNGNFLRVNPDGTFTGVIWDMLNALKATTHFDFTLSLQEDGLYGAPNANGVWNGVIGALLRNETDIIANLIITSQRATAIDFTVPFLPIHLVIISQPNASLTNIKYAVKDSSADVIYLRGSKEPRALQIWTNVQANLPTSLVPDDSTGLALVRQGGWAYVSGDHTNAMAISTSSCPLVINRPLLHTFYAAMGLQPGSPLQRPLSIAIMKAMATGVIQQVLTKWDLDFDV